MSSTSHPTSPDVEWRKSSYSNGSGGECVLKVAPFADRALIRDSKDPDGPVLAFPAGAWDAFVRAVKGGAEKLRLMLGPHAPTCLPPQCRRPVRGSRSYSGGYSQPSDRGDRMDDNRTSVIEAAFRCYRSQDREAALALYADDFTFTSPQDDHIDRGGILRAMLPDRRPIQGPSVGACHPRNQELVFVYYEYELTTGERIPQCRGDHRKGRPDPGGAGLLRRQGVRRPRAAGTPGGQCPAGRYGMSFRLAAYAVCIEDGRVLLAHHVAPRTGLFRAAGSSTGRIRSTR